MENYSEDLEVLHVDDLVIYDNDIEEAIAEACQKFKIDNLKMEGQRPWKAVLQFVGNRVFCDRSILKSKTLNHYEKNKIPSTCNSYDYDLIYKICDYYIYLSNMYNKFVSAEGFSYFTNIPKDTIDNWKHTEPSSTSFRIWKKVQDIRLESIKDDALDNKHVTGTMFVGNVEYGLNLPGVSKEVAQRPALTIDQLPQLGVKKPETIVQIAQMENS